MKKLLLLAIALLVALPVSAQRVTDKLDRGLVAVPATGGGMLVSWRMFAEEYYDYTYNLYCDGTLLKSGLTVTNFHHTAGTGSKTYQVVPVFKGVEQTELKSAEVQPWSNGCLTIPVQPITGRDGRDVTEYYTLNDISMGDLDGDGVVEFIVKRPCSLVTDLNNKNCFHVLDCYHRDGRRLWWIDLGPNMLSGADEQWDCVCYDWDEDGKAEVLLRIQDNAYIHYPDGTTKLIGSSSVDTRWNGIEYTSSGNEYLLYLEGETGKPYEIGTGSTPELMAYPLTRGNDTDWGSGIVGHRSTKHYFAAPFFDGRHASIFLGRGAYTKHKMAAYDVDPATHQLTRRWYWENSSSGPWFGQGYHNFQVADVDWDGRDEIVFGSMIIDDNGKGLTTTGLGHGDAQHCSDFDPYRKYQEQFACNESSPANNYRNAATSEIYYRLSGGGDDGRALMANFTNDYPGAVGRSVGSGWIGACADKIISELGGDAFISWGDLNQRIYWDGDLLDEYFDSPGTEGYGAIYKPTSKSAQGGRWNFPDSKCSNWSKNNPGAIGDIFGDWREELVMRRSDNKAILVYTTGIPTNNVLPTLWHDHQYRNAMVWQSMGYNQPPHKSYYVGELEGITTAPAPLTMTGRVEVPNGGTITTTADHLIVCETNDTQVSIAEGASPYIVTFNVPSWVQGNAASNTTGKPAPTYTYYTCTVTGGGFTGNTRVIKQGDGTLILPAVEMTHIGETNVWAGKLVFDGKMSKSSLWLNRFAELEGNGTFSSLRADYGAVIRPGGEGKIGTITSLNNLKLGFGSLLVLELDGNNQLADQICTKSLSIETKNWEYGPKYLQPVIQVMPLAGTELMPGRYCIGSASSLSGSLDKIKVEGTGMLKSSLSLEEGKIWLTLGAVRSASHIVWTGSKGNVWDYANTPNFVLWGDESAAPEIFVSGDEVDFTDDAALFKVTVKDEMEVDTLRIASAADYTFEGTGLIKKGAFVKTGSGKVTMNNDNTYTGGTFLRGGTTIVKTLASTTQSYGGLGAASSATSRFVMENGAILQTTAGIQHGSAMMMKGDKGGVLQLGAGFTQQKTIAGTVLTKKGTGALTLSVNNTLKRLVVTAGDVHASTETPAQTIEMQGGTLNLNAASNVEIVIPIAKSAKVYYNGDRAAYGNKLTGEGTLQVYYPVVVGTDWKATRCAVNGDWSEFQGTVRPYAKDNADGRFCFNNSFGLPNAKLDIPSGVIVQSTGRSFAIGQLAGSGTLGGGCSLSSAAAGNATWNVGSAENSSFSGKVSSNAAFNKVGSGQLSVSGAWDNTLEVSILEGSVKLSSAASLGKGALTVALGTRLFGNQTTGTLANSSVTINGELCPILVEGTSLGTIKFANQAVTFGNTGTLRLGIGGVSASASSMSGTYITDIKTLTFKAGALISLFLTDGYELHEGDVLRLWSNVTNVSGTPLIEVDGYSQAEFDLSRLSEGVIVVKGQPVAIDAVSAAQPATEGAYDLNGRPASAADASNRILIQQGRKSIKY